MKQYWIFIIIILIYVYFGFVGYSYLNDILSRTMMTVVIIPTLIFSYLVIKPVKNIHILLSFAFIFFFIAFFLDFLAFLIWLIYGIFGETPDISPADYFWTTSYFFLIYFLGIESFLFRQLFISNRKVIIFSLLLFSFIYSLMIFLLKDTIFSPELSFFDYIYVIMDGIILALTIPFLIFSVKELISKIYSYLFFGILLWSMGDIFYNITFSFGIYYGGNFVDAFYSLGYLSISYGFYLYHTEILKIVKK
jgi:hypothetical protein